MEQRSVCVCAGGLMEEEGIGSILSLGDIETPLNYKKHASLPNSSFFNVLKFKHMLEE